MSGKVYHMRKFEKSPSNLSQIYRVVNLGCLERLSASGNSKKFGRNFQQFTGDGRSGPFRDVSHERKFEKTRLKCAQIYRGW